MVLSDDGIDRVSVVQNQVGVSTRLIYLFGLFSFTSFAFISTASKVSGRMAGDIRLIHETNNISHATEVPTDNIPLLNEQFESRGKLTSAIRLYFANQNASVKLDKRRSGGGNGVMICPSKLPGDRLYDPKSKCAAEVRFWKSKDPLNSNAPWP